MLPLTTEICRCILKNSKLKYLIEVDSFFNVKKEVRKVVILDKRLKKSLKKYGYWSPLFGKTPKGPTVTKSECQSACAPGDPCSAPE